MEEFENHNIHSTQNLQDKLLDNLLFLCHNKTSLQISHDSTSNLIFLKQ